MTIKELTWEQMQQLLHYRMLRELEPTYLFNRKSPNASLDRQDYKRKHVQGWAKHICRDCGTYISVYGKSGYCQHCVAQHRKNWREQP